MGGMCCKAQQNVTVANDSGEVIYAKVELDKKFTIHKKGGLQFQGIGHGIGVDVAKQYDWTKVNPGFNKILDKASMRFEVVTRKGKQVYISIAYENGVLLIDALPKTAPCGVKIKPSGALAPVMRGNHVWTTERISCGSMLEEQGIKQPKTGGDKNAMVNKQAGSDGDKNPIVIKQAGKDPIVYKQANSDADKNPMIRKQAVKDPIVRKQAVKDPIVRKQAVKDPIVKKQAGRDGDKNQTLIKQASRYRDKNPIVIKQPGKDPIVIKQPRKDGDKNTMVIKQTGKAPIMVHLKDIFVKV